MAEGGCDMRAFQKMLNEYETLAEKPEAFVGKPVCALLHPTNCAHKIPGVEPGLDGQNPE